MYIYICICIYIYNLCFSPTAEENALLTTVALVVGSKAGAEACGGEVIIGIAPGPAACKGEGCEMMMCSIWHSMYRRDRRAKRKRTQEQG